MFLVSFVVLLGMTHSVSAIVINDTQIWEGKLGISGDTLKIGPEGHLTVPANEWHELLDGAHLVINSGTMIVGGTRLRVETGSTITVNAGLLPAIISLPPTIMTYSRGVRPSTSRSMVC